MASAPAARHPVQWPGETTLGATRFTRSSTVALIRSLHGRSGQVVSADQEVDRPLRKQPQRLQCDVDDAGVGARRQDGGSAAAHAGRKEALVVDLRVWDGLPRAPGVVPPEPGLICRHARDVPTGEEEAARHCVRVCLAWRSVRPPPRSPQRWVPRGASRTCPGGENAALIRSVRVHVDEGWRPSARLAGLGDSGDHDRYPSRVVPVPVRDEQHGDLREVDAQPAGVAQPQAPDGPTSNRTVAASSPRRPVATVEKPWQATHSARRRRPCRARHASRWTARRRDGRIRGAAGCRPRSTTRCPLRCPRRP